MLGSDQFDDKAKRLLLKLSSLSTVNVNKSRIRTESTLLSKTVNLNELLRISEEMESTDEEARKKIKGVRDQIKKLEHSANEENESRNRLHDNFVATITKVDKNMKSALAGVKKSFQEREKKLQQKIEVILKNERKEIEMKMEENEDLLQQVKELEIKVQAIIEEVNVMRKTRVELEDKINRQFLEQIKELKRIFEKDLREREEKESQLIGVLKRLYKAHMESIHNEEVEREANEKMLLTVVEQLVNRIMEAVYKYEHPEFGPVMLLLDDNEPQQKEPATFRTIGDQMKGRGISHNPTISVDKKSVEKKSIQRQLRLSSEKKKKKTHLPSLYQNRYE